MTPAELRPAAAAQRAPARGHHQPGDLVAAAAAQALRERGVLRVDRHDLTGCGPARDQRPADDQRLLVGERKCPARVDGGERGGEPGGARYRVQHDIAGPCRHLGDRRRPGEYLRHAELPAGVATALCLGVTRELHVLSGAAPLHGDRPRPPVRAPARPAGLGSRRRRPGQSRPEPAGISPDDVDGLGAYRTGRAEDDKIAICQAAVAARGHSPAPRSSW